MGHPVRAESPKVGQEIRIPARTGVGLRVAGGEYVQDVEGRGCADLFALAAENLAEHLSGLAHPVQIMDCLVVLSAWLQQWNPATHYHPSDLLARILTR
jgi:hypothetical protein